MLSKTEHLLVILGEEGSEVSKATTKALRFGLDTKWKDRPTTSKEDIIQEFIDVTALVEMLCKENVLSIPDDFSERVEAKISKVEFMMQYSKSQKTLKM